MRQGGEETGDECRATVRYRSGGEEAPLPTHTPRHSTRVEWLEWWKGWPHQGGAFPLWSAWDYCGDMRRVRMRER